MTAADIAGGLQSRRSTLAGMPITPADLARLAAAGIPPEVARQAQLRRVTSQEGGALVGRNGAGDYSGIAFPYFLPGSDQVRDYRLRLDHPPMEYKDGKPHERQKYLASPGRGNMLYFVPGTPAEWTQITALSLVITEGEKKTLALWSLAHHGLGDATEFPRFLPIGLSGVWNWRATVGKTTGADGDRRDVKGPIVDLDRLAWKGRPATIIFDANVHTNDSVAAARHELAKELTRRGAKVQYLDLPTVNGVNGIDDLVGVWGPERVLELFAGTRPWRKESQARPIVMSADELMRAKIEVPGMLVEHMLAKHGANLICGAQRSNKTLLMAQAAIAVAAGRTMLDCYRVTASGPVLFVEQDDPGGMASFQQILCRSLIPTQGIPLYPAFKVPFSFGPEFFLWLESEIKQKGLVMAVLDSYTALRPTRRGGADLVKLERDELATLDELAKRNCCCLAIIHHESQGTKRNAVHWSDRAGGTFALTAATEMMVHICRFPELDSDAPERLVRTRGRHDSGVEFVMRFRLDTLDHEFVLEGPAAEVYPLLAQLRREFGGQVITPRLLVEVTGVARATAHRQIERLFRAGVLDKRGYGEYVLRPRDSSVPI